MTEARAKVSEAADAASDRAYQAKDRLPPSISKLIDEVRDADVLLFAGGLAFYGLISIAPFIVISFWIAGGVLGEDRIEEMGENLDEMAPGGADVSQLFDTMADVGTGVGVAALVAALWPATAYGSGLVRAFDRISHREDRSVQGLRGRLKALLFLVLLPLFLISGLGASYLVSGLFDDGALMILGWFLGLLAGFVAGTITCTVIYWVFGPGRLPLRAVLEGAAAASGAIAVMSLGYVIYLGQGADFEERVAGSGFAAVVLLALWLYLANAILLAGYTLARSFAGTTGDKDQHDGEGKERSRH